MRCLEVGRMMSLALDGMLSAEEEAGMLGHLADCPACEAHWQALQSVSGLLVETPLASPTMDLSLWVEAELRQQQERRRWAVGLLTGWLWLGTALAGFAACSLLLGWTLVRSPLLLSTGIQVFVRLLMASEAMLQALRLLGTSLLGSWLPVSATGCLVPAMLMVCLWMWLALRPQAQTVSIS